MSANHQTIVRWLEIDAISLLEIDIQMIGPETNHHFKKLALAVDAA